MTTTPLDEGLLQEIHDLVTAHLQRQMTVAQRERLEDLVCHDPVARRLYVDYIFDCFDLHSRAATDLSELTFDCDGDLEALASRRPAATPQITNLAMAQNGWLKTCVNTAARPMVLLVLVVVFGALAAWRLTNLSDESPAVPGALTQGKQPTALPVARIVRSVDAIWDEGSGADPAGKLAIGQVLSLRSGMAEIDYDSGTHVVIEGPAAFEIESANSGRLSVGRLVASVPPAAVGFAIDTPATKVIDLGTEFGVAVDRVGAADVHVFRGNVTAQPASGTVAAASPPLELREGQSAQFTPGALSSSGPARPMQPITVGNADFERFAQLISARRDADTDSPAPLASTPAEAEALLRWQQQSDGYSKDPDVILHYTFQDVKPTDKSVPNRAATGPEPRAEIRGAEVAAGRWAGKGAMQFDGRAGRLHLVVPGEYRTLSMLAWVYLARPSQYGMSLVNGDGLMRYGMLKWDLTGQEAINFAAHYPEQGTVNYVTPPNTIKIAGRWAHLAVVYDGGQKQVFQYLDGKSLGGAKIVSDLPLAPGAISIGGWQLAEDKFHGQFEGRIDELTILKRALTAEEVQQAFAQSQVKQP